MKRRKIVIGISSGLAFLLVAVVVGLVFSGMYTC